MEITVSGSNLVISNEGHVSSYPKKRIAILQNGNAIQVMYEDKIVQSIQKYQQVTIPLSTSADNLFNNLNALIS